MFRALSTKKGHGEYEKLAISGAPVGDRLSNEKLIRSTTLPTNILGDSPTFESVLRTPMREKAVEKQAKKARKLHPIFTIFQIRGRSKNATAKPEFSRYMQYLKEGGTWNANESKPVIY